MKKLFAVLGLIAAFTLLPTVTVGAAPPPGPAGAVERVPAWNLVGNYTVTFNCATCVAHTITIKSYNPHTGVFSGYGAYAANPAYTWSVAGSLIGNKITMKIVYTGQNAGYTVTLGGAVSVGGVASGMATDSSGASFGWSMAGPIGQYKNHGHFVCSQHDKRTAARSDFGKPIR